MPHLIHGLRTYIYIAKIVLYPKHHYNYLAENACIMWKTHTHTCTHTQTHVHTHRHTRMCTHTHTRTHTRAHTHTCTHTHLFLLLTPCPLRTLGRIQKTMLVHSASLSLVYDNSPCFPVFHSLLPVGHPNQVSADHANPMQWSFPWPSSLPLWSAPIGVASRCNGQASTAHDLVIAVVFASAAPPWALPLLASRRLHFLPVPQCESKDVPHCI